MIGFQDDLDSCEGLKHREQQRLVAFMIVLIADNRLRRQVLLDPA